MSVASALIKALEYDLPSVLNGNGKEYRPREDEISVYSFPQLWSSTALGFGGIGGAAMTTAQTVVVIHEHNAAVYFNGYHAYTIEGFNQTLMEDVRSGNIADCDSCGKYRRQ